MPAPRNSNRNRRPTSHPTTPKSEVTPGGFSEAVALYHERVATSQWTPHRPERPLDKGASKPLKLVSLHPPAGDQPAAIDELVDGVKKGEFD